VAEVAHRRRQQQHHHQQRQARVIRVLLLSLLLAAGSSGTALADSMPKAELWDRWTQHDEAAPRVLDHTLWDRFLSRYVVVREDGTSHVRYGAIDSDDRGYLRVYLDQLQRTEVSKLRRDEQRAYWINLYNAYTVKLVVDRYPMVSLRSLDISPGFFTKGPWGAKMLKVEDETLSLDDIEHRVLRPIWKDPRLHYALCPASRGGPALSAHAYTASNTETQLDAAARAFVNHPRGARMDGSSTVLVSSLYEWFEADFGGTDAGVIAHLLQYADAPLAESLRKAGRVRDGGYDWLLNDDAPAAP
jgi:hypothetical protein